MTKPQPRTNMRTCPGQIAGLVYLELWKSIADYEGYFVSSLGRVCSVDREVKGQLCRGRVLRPGPSVSGHLTVSLTRYNSKSVHILVLEAFVGPRPEGQEGLHWDDNATNNHLSNLRWGTRSANLYDAVRNGKKPVGTDLYNAKLTPDAVRYIRANLHVGDYNLAKLFNVSGAAVKQVRDGVTWKHVA